ncbi:MAG: peroxiredoxin [Candidatus Methylomirabilales bacterium]
MLKSNNPYGLPPNLPAPVDDGACDHLPGAALPLIPLMSTAGVSVVLADIPGRVIVYCYPRTGRPGVDPPPGWNQIPGATGCTPQSCAFRDVHAQLRAIGVRVYGLSTQETDYQREVVERLHLPFELLSDSALALTRALQLPTFEIASSTFIKRLTLVVAGGRIEKVFYPVFPPDANAGQVVEWLLSKEAV